MIRAVITRARLLVGGAVLAVVAVVVGGVVLRSPDDGAGPDPVSGQTTSPTTSGTAAASGPASPSVPTTSTPSSPAPTVIDTRTFGPDCAQINRILAVGDMLDVPVAAAIAPFREMSTFEQALRRASLYYALNDPAALTVFVPSNAAFADLSKSERDGLLADAGALSLVLTHGVIGENLGPDKLVGTHQGLAGELTVTGSGHDLTVNGAKIICGNIRTQNATVYLVDSLLGAR